MRNIYKQLIGDITSESIYPIIETINDLDIKTKLYIAITSEGGESYSSRFLIQILNEQRNVDKITLIGVDKCYSAAFDIFYKFKGRKQIMLGTRGMLHYDSIDIRHCHKDQLKFDDEVNTTFDQLELLKQETIKYGKSFLNTKEMELLKEGKDVFFSFNRMLQIFKDVEVV